jgi:predicted peptidase
MYLGSRYPDIFSGAIPVSSYLAASYYVPSIPMSHGIHFTDPVLQGILQASLAGADNDLFLGNVAGIIGQPDRSTRRKWRMFHGGDDENVPVWNSRKAYEIIKSFDVHADVRQV